MRTTLLISMLMLWLTPGVWAQDHAKVVAFADVAEIQSGTPFYVGVKFTISPGWHIYWRNPGDSGLATDVKLSLPEGFKAGELQFPVPSRFESPGPIINYGYENEVMLLIRVTPPAGLSVGQKLTISGKASWLVCDKDNCIPGDGDLSINLTTAAKSSAANTELFDGWISKLPRPDDNEFVSSRSASASSSNGSGTASLELKWKREPREVQFIPDAQTSTFFEITTSTEKNETKILFRTRGHPGLTPVTGLVTFLDEHDQRSGFEENVGSVSGN
jgi:thiol:disulfide interchange protein DsbD